MLEIVGRFIQRHGLVLLCFSVLVGALWCICLARWHRVRVRERSARELEDALLQNAQGLILNVHGIVKDLRVDDPTRLRMERALDKADAQLSEDRDRVQDLRMTLSTNASLQHSDQGEHDLPRPVQPPARGAQPRDRIGWLRQLVRWATREE